MTWLGKDNVQAIYSGPLNELSVYRLVVDQVHHLAILGQTPPENFQHKLESILAAGESVELSQVLLKTLAERRRQSTRQGPWVEKHFRPGRRL